MTVFCITDLDIQHVVAVPFLPQLVGPAKDSTIIKGPFFGICGRAGMVKASSMQNLSANEGPAYVLMQVD